MAVNDKGEFIREGPTPKVAFVHPVATPSQAQPSHNSFLIVIICLLGVILCWLVTQTSRPPGAPAPPPNSSVCSPPLAQATPPVTAPRVSDPAPVSASPVVRETVPPPVPRVVRSEPAPESYPTTSGDGGRTPPSETTVEPARPAVPSEPPPSAPASGATQAREVLLKFYSRIRSGEYARAYEFLSEGWKSQLSLEQFAAGYDNTEDVEFAEPDLISCDGSTCVFGIRVAASEKGERQRVRYTYTLIRESGDWVVDRGSVIRN